jgi:hypothetical protein
VLHDDSVKKRAEVEVVQDVQDREKVGKLSAMLYDVSVESLSAEGMGYTRARISLVPPHGDGTTSAI